MTLDRITGPMSLLVGITFSVVTGALACYYAFLLGGEPIAQSILVTFAAGLTLIQISFAHDALTISHRSRYIFGAIAVVLLVLSVGASASVLETLYQTQNQQSLKSGDEYKRALKRYQTSDDLVRQYQAEIERYKKKNWPQNEKEAREKMIFFSEKRDTAEDEMKTIRPTASVAGLGSLEDGSRWTLWISLGALVDIVRTLAFWLASIKEGGETTEFHIPSEPDPIEDKPVRHPSKPRPYWVEHFSYGEQVTMSALRKRLSIGQPKAKEILSDGLKDGWLLEMDGLYFINEPKQ